MNNYRASDELEVTQDELEVAFLRAALEAGWSEKEIVSGLETLIVIAVLP